jgi:CheY-like chemotaxis protein
MKKVREAKILIADDDLFYRKFFQKVMEKADLKHRIVSNGSQAVMELISTKDKFDCVVLDIYMDGMDGIETTRLIRRFSETLPIVMITADLRQETENRARYAGINAFMTKPFTDTEFLDVIRDAMSGERNDVAGIEASADY